MDDKEFVGTVTPAEARKTIFEDVLGFKQEDLAGVKIGFNRGRILTFKLKQQVDIDDIYEWENFTFERSVGKDVSSVRCFINGLRDPNKRRNVIQSVARTITEQERYIPDDGTRLVKIIGCDYKLQESEILDWLSLFGDVISEIKEELFGDAEDQTCQGLPPVGNGNYLVTMRLQRDLPNFMPIYGRRICLEHKGIRKQC